LRRPFNKIRTWWTPNSIFGISCSRLWSRQKLFGHYPTSIAAWLQRRPSDIDDFENEIGTPMTPFAALALSRTLIAPLFAALLCLASAPSLAADDPDAPRGAAVTVLKAAKSCFDNIVEVSGLVIPREETSVRPERPGLKVAEILADAGDSVTAGQTLARLTLPEGGTVQVQAPVAGLIANSTAAIGAVA
jgi:hypothetical protein